MKNEGIYSAVVWCVLDYSFYFRAAYVFYKLSPDKQQKENQRQGLKLTILSHLKCVT